MKKPTLTINHTPVHGMWTAEVTRLQASLTHLAGRRVPVNACVVSFFEVPGDRDLHVNVIHERQPAAVKGWSGPAAVRDGFVLNRRFHSRVGILGHVEEVIFASSA